MPGNCLAFARELRKAGSFNDACFPLFLRAASSTTDSNKNFVKDVVVFLSLRKLGVGWYLVFFRGCLSEDASSKSSTGPFPHPCVKLFSSIAMLSSFHTVNTGFERLQGMCQVKGMKWAVRD